MIYIYIYFVFLSVFLQFFFYFFLIGFSLQLVRLSMEVGIEHFQMLHNLNKHRRDEMICFKENGHEYTIDVSRAQELANIENHQGDDKVVPHSQEVLRNILKWEKLHPKDEQKNKEAWQKGTSVTTIIQKYFPAFDADAVIARMRKSANWTRSKYFGMTNDEIKSLWQCIGDRSREDGHNIHARIEDHFNGKSTFIPDYLAEHEDTSPPTSKEGKNCKMYRQFLNWLQQNPSVKPFRTEWCLFSDHKSLICGTPDFISLTEGYSSYNNSLPGVYSTDEYDAALESLKRRKRAKLQGGTGADEKKPHLENFVPEQDVLRLEQSEPRVSSCKLHVTIYDWKTCRKIDMKNFYKDGKGFAPFDKLPNTNFSHYVVQLNMYKYMLEKFYKYVEVEGVVHKGIIVDGMWLMCVNPGFEDYQQYFVPPLTNGEIETVFQNRELELASELNICLPTTSTHTES